MFRVPEPHRVRTGLLGTSEKNGNNGLFVFGRKGVSINCIVSDGEDWEHVSVTMGSRGNKKLLTRCPTWDEMCFVKSVFWEETDAVIQVHPGRSDYVNCHPYCLHLWRPTNQALVLPPKRLVNG